MTRPYHPYDKHPGQAQQDLNPDASAGQNYGLVGHHPEKAAGIPEINLAAVQHHVAGEGDVLRVAGRGREKRSCKHLRVAIDGSAADPDHGGISGSHVSAAVSNLDEIDVCDG